MKAKERLIRRIPTASELDSVKARQKKTGTEKDLALLELCGNLWQTGDVFRRNRARAFRFTYVDQLSDPIVVDGKRMTQREYLLKTGNVALQTNQMKSKVETMEGVVVKEALEPVCMARDRDEQQYGEVMTATLQANCTKNKMSELEIAWVKEACLGGLMVGYESWDGSSGPVGTIDSWTQYVNPNLVFFDSTMDDPRFWDMSIVGRVRKLDFGKVCSYYAHNERDVAILKDIYATQADLFKTKAILYSTRDRFEESMATFMSDADPSVCCVCEVWTKETKARIRLHDTNEGKEYIIDADDKIRRKEFCAENERRRAQALQAGWSEEETPYIIGDGYGSDEASKNGWFMDEFWYCRNLAPDGTILWEGESPLPGRSHPFSLCAIPMIDGQIIGFLYDMIDHNIIMNRAICLNDWLIRTNAKGVVVVPKQLLGGKTELEFANSWTAIGEMVFIDVKPGYENLMPKVFYGNAQTFDVSKYLDTFSRMGDKSTAITDALQGKTPFAGASGALYAQMSNNSSTAIASFLMKVHDFLTDVHTKKLKNIAEFYTPERFASIVGSIDGVFDNENLNLNEIKNIEYDLSLKESVETPVYRAIVNQDAKEFLMAGLIDFETYLDITAVPYADKVKQHMQARQAEMQAAQQGQIPAAAMQTQPGAPLPGQSAMPQQTILQ